MGALQTNVEYLTDRIINSNATPNNNNSNNINSGYNANYAPTNNDPNLVANSNSSNDFDIMEPQIESAIDQVEGI